MGVTGPSQREPLIALEEVTKRFPGVVALEQVSLSFRPGEVQVLLGENGAGKSTLISLLSGMQRPDEGRILMAGRPLRLDSPRQALGLGIGTVYQHSTLVPSLSILDNLILGARWWSRLDRQQTRGHLATMARRLQITLPEDALLGSLSLGQRQLVEIVKALWRGERLLVLDEPTSMLSPAEAQELLGVVSQLRDGGTSVLFVTHKLSEALAFGDSISVLKAGRLAGELSVAQLAALGEREATDRIVGLMFDRQTEARSSTIPRPKAPRDQQPVILRVEALQAATAPTEPQLENISFSLRAGEILGIAGVEGNGQKQLAEALAGQRPCLAGRIELEGKPVHELDVPGRQKRGLRYLSDDRLGEASLGSFPLDLNLLLKRIGDAPFWHRGIEQPGPIEAHARRLIRRHDIRTPGPKTAIGRLSGGNIQKALLGRELDGQAKVVIYNKPTYGLDLQNIALARHTIAGQAAAGVASLLISTDLDEILELSDRVAVMSRGRIAGVLEDGEVTRRGIGELMIGDDGGP